MFLFLVMFFALAAWDARVPDPALVAVLSSSSSLGWIASAAAVLGSTLSMAPNTVICLFCFGRCTSTRREQMLCPIAPPECWQMLNEHCQVLILALTKELFTASLQEMIHVIIVEGDGIFGSASLTVVVTSYHLKFVSSSIVLWDFLHELDGPALVLKSPCKSMQYFSTTHLHAVIPDLVR